MDEPTRTPASTREEPLGLVCVGKTLKGVRCTSGAMPEADLDGEHRCFAHAERTRGLRKVNGDVGRAMGHLGGRPRKVKRVPPQVLAAKEARSLGSAAMEMVPDGPNPVVPETLDPGTREGRLDIVRCALENLFNKAWPVGVSGNVASLLSVISKDVRPDPPSGTEDPLLRLVREAAASQQEFSDPTEES